MEISDSWLEELRAPSVSSGVGTVPHARVEKVSLEGLGGWFFLEISLEGGRDIVLGVCLVLDVVEKIPYR